MARVVVAMSGGVDSSVAAWLLQQQGHEVIGLFMRTGVTPEDRRPDQKKGCCSSLDAYDARRVADRLGFPFYALDCAEQFDRVMDYFAAEYVQGRTPNPCVMCNQWLKFGHLWDYGRHLGADWIATGHYAQVRHGPDGPELHRAVDSSKDQSYVLFGTPRAVLERLLLPVGALPKSAVRELARSAGLPVFAKPDSVSACFLPDGDAAHFVARRRPESALPGPILDRQGNVVGTHEGIAGITVGQRKGLGVAAGRRRFVLEVLPEHRALVVGSREEALCTSAIVERCQWLIEPAAWDGKLEVKYTYRDAPAAAWLRRLAGDRVAVSFLEPQFGIAPGQAAVFYGGTRVLGGGWLAGNEKPAGAIQRSRVGELEIEG